MRLGWKVSTAYYPYAEGRAGLTRLGTCSSMMCAQEADSHGCPATLHFTGKQLEGLVCTTQFCIPFFTGFWSYHAAENTLPTITAPSVAKAIATEIRHYWGPQCFSCSNQIILANIFFSTYLLNTCNPQDSLHNFQTIHATIGKLSHTQAFNY